MANLKKVQIIGNCGRAPETRFLPDGTNVTSFSVGVNERGRGEDGEEKTTWFRVSCWRKLGEIAASLVKQGTSVYIAGDLTVREYSTNDGEKRFSVDISAQDMQVLTPKAQNTGAGSTSNPVVADDDESDIPF